MDWRKVGAHSGVPCCLGACHEEIVQDYLVDVLDQHDINKVARHRLDQAEAQLHASTLSGQLRFDLFTERSRSSHPLRPDTAKQTRAQRRRRTQTQCATNHTGQYSTITLIGLGQVCGREVLKILKVLHV